MVPMLSLPIKDRQETDTARPATAEARRLDTRSLQRLQQALRLAHVNGLLRLCQADDKWHPAARCAEALLVDRSLREAELPSSSGHGIHQPFRSAGVDVRSERLM